MAEGLCRSVREMPSGPGCVSLAFLGQSGVLLGGIGGRLLAIDPYLTNSLAQDRDAGPRGRWERLPVSPLHPDELDVDTVLISHEHLDHFDKGSLQTHGRRARELVAPPQLRDAAEGLGALFRAAVVGVSMDIGGVTVTPIEAVHSIVPGRAEGPAESDAEVGRCVGYIVRFEDGSTVYHSGDTLLEPRLIETIRSYAPGLVVLPINGRSPEREAVGIVGNMTMLEALRFGLLLGCPWLLPCHHDMFRVNGASIGEFVGLAAAAGYPRILYPALGCPVAVMID